MAKLEKNEEIPLASPVLREYGVTGLARWGRFITEEWQRELQGLQGRRIFREMADSDPTIGALLFAIRQVVSGAKWKVMAASDEPEDREAAAFVESCLSDMNTPWSDFISEVLSMLVYGFAPFEILYKLRLGPRQANPIYRSRFSDSRFGWLDFAIRAQETIVGWEFDEYGNLVGMVQVAPPDYKERIIPREKLLLFRTEVHKGNPEGRALHPDTPVLTPTGCRPIGDLKVGDTVYDARNLPVQVIAIQPWSQRRLFEIEFETGETVLADGEHLWTVLYREYRSGPEIKERTLTAPTKVLSGLMYRNVGLISGNSKLLVPNCGRPGETFYPVRITRINYIRKRADTVCIQVASPTAMFKILDRGIPTHNSILRNVYRSYYFIKHIEAIEGIGVERDLAGIPVLYVPEELMKEPQRVEALRQLVRSLRRDEHEGVLLPWDPVEGKPIFKLELLSSAGSRQLDTSRLIERHKRDLARIALADFILLGLERGSYALMREKRALFETAVMAWLQVIADELNSQAIPRLFEVNGWELQRLPKLTFQLSTVPSFEDVSNILDVMVRAGFDIGTDIELENWLRSLISAPEKRLPAM